MDAKTHKTDQFGNILPEALSPDTPQKIVIPSPKRSPISHQFKQFFVFAHLKENLKPTSQAVGELAEKMINELPENPEKSAGLRKLLEAKDCFVRALLWKDPES